MQDEISLTKRVCAHRWKPKIGTTQKKSASVVGRLVCKPSRVQSSRSIQVVELRQLLHREASLYCIRESMGSQWREARRDTVSFGNSQDKVIN